MTNLLTRVRRAASTTRQAVLAIAAPARLFTEQTPTAAAAPEPVDLYTEDEMPAAEEIEAAAARYYYAGEAARSADRQKRSSKKVLDRLPAGTYGTWLLERVPSARQTADLDAIAKLFKAHGLGPVPMKSCSASIKVHRVVVATAPVLAEVA